MQLKPNLVAWLVYPACPTWPVVIMRPSKQRNAWVVRLLGDLNRYCASACSSSLAEYATGFMHIYRTDPVTKCRLTHACTEAHAHIRSVALPEQYRILNLPQIAAFDLQVANMSNINLQLHPAIAAGVVYFETNPPPRPRERARAGDGKRNNVDTRKSVNQYKWNTSMYQEKKNNKATKRESHQV